MTIELGCGSEAEALLARRQCLSHLPVSMQKVIEEEVARSGLGDRVLRIGRLDIDLGVISINGIGSADMLEKLRMAFREQLRKAEGTALGGSGVVALAAASGASGGAASGGSGVVAEVDAWRGVTGSGGLRSGSRVESWTNVFAGLRGGTRATGSTGGVSGPGSTGGMSSASSWGDEGVAQWKSPQESIAAILIAFLLTGSIPWWADGQVGADIDRLFVESMDGAPGMLRDFLEHHRYNRVVVQRIYVTVRPATLRRIDKMLVAGSGATVDGDAGLGLDASLGWDAGSTLATGLGLDAGSGSATSLGWGESSGSDVSLGSDASLGSAATPASGATGRSGRAAGPQVERIPADADISGGRDSFGAPVAFGQSGAASGQSGAASGLSGAEFGVRLMTAFEASPIGRKWNRQAGSPVQPAKSNWRWLRKIGLGATQPNLSSLTLIKLAADIRHGAAARAQEQSAADELLLALFRFLGIDPIVSTLRWDERHLLNIVLERESVQGKQEEALLQKILNKLAPEQRDRVAFLSGLSAAELWALAGEAKGSSREEGSVSNWPGSNRQEGSMANWSGSNRQEGSVPNWSGSGREDGAAPIGKGTNRSEAPGANLQGPGRQEGSASNREEGPASNRHEGSAPGRKEGSAPNRSEATGANWSEATGAGRLFIQNAGLCLVAAYLPLFFTRLGYVSKGAFQNAAAATRAVMLLQYLVAGPGPVAEYQLQLNKLLCGLEMTAPLEKISGLRKKERQEADDLLESIIQHWAALKNTSLAGFRSSFLQRDGLLTAGPQGWTLRVERKSHDILLGTIGWSFQLIKHPWMEKHIQVEW